MNVTQEIVESGIIPVIRAESGEFAMRAVDAIKSGGISILEITMTVPGAIRVIEDLVKRFDDSVIVGAGTVLDAKTAEDCIRAGAKFVVSPALNLETVAACRSRNITVMPGALTPTEVVTAWAAGADFVKIFPAGAVGGPGYLKSLKAPLPQVRMVPTGGVSLKNAAEFIKAGAAALGVGADLVDIGLIRKNQDSVITERARLFLEAVNEARKN